MKVRSLSRFKSAVGLALLCSFIPAGLLWARPSLIVQEAELQQVIDGLCHGDPALCGLSAPLVVAGQLDFDGLFQADFFDLTFGFVKNNPGALAYEELTASVDASEIGTMLTQVALSVMSLGTVTVVVPDPQGPGNVAILELTNAFITSIDSSGGRATTVKLGFEKANYSWLGSTSEWDQNMGTGAGCTIPNGESNVARNGTSVPLGPGDREAEFAFGITPPLPQLGFELTRTPRSTSACVLRHAATAVNLDVDVHRLSPLSDTFATQLREQSLEITNSKVGDYQLHIVGTEFTETIEIDITASQLTTRTFNPGNGNEDSSITVGVP